MIHRGRIDKKFGKTSTEIAHGAANAERILTLNRGH